MQHIVFMDVQHIPALSQFILSNLIFNLKYIIERNSFMLRIALTPTQIVNFHTVHVIQGMLRFPRHQPVDCKCLSYRKNSKIWDTSNNCHNCPKNRKVWCNIALMHPKDADGIANSVDPDQTASS